MHFSAKRTSPLDSKLSKKSDFFLFDLTLIPNIKSARVQSGCFFLDLEGSCDFGAFWREKDFDIGFKRLIQQILTITISASGASEANFFCTEANF